MAQPGVNQIDRMTGYLGFNNGGPQPTPTRHQGHPGRVRGQPGSLLGKATVAQTVFDNKFLLPFAPERREFFLVPGNNQVTVLWAESADRDGA